MKGIIYLIANQYNISRGSPPYFYIGSKQDAGRFDAYWSSSKFVAEDIAKYGYSSFLKVILEEVDYMHVEELLKIEHSYHVAFSCSTSDNFYNKRDAYGAFHCDTAKGTTWINNGKSNKRVEPKEIAYWSKYGYVAGRLGGDYNSGRVYINNGQQSKSVEKENLAEYLRSGWLRGKLKSNQIGTVWINREGINKMVNKTALDDYLVQGWSKGCLMKKQTG